MQDPISVRKKQSLFSHKAVPYLFIAPFIIFFVIVYLYPFFKTIMMSFQRIDGPNHISWIGWQNGLKTMICTCLPPIIHLMSRLETTSRLRFCSIRLHPTS